MSIQIDRVTLDDPRLGAIAADELRERLFALPSEVVETLVDAQLRSKLGTIASWHPDAEVDLLTCGEVPLAYLVIAADGRAVRVCDIAVAIAERGRGHGTALLGQLLQRADAERRPITLSVWNDSPAREWYRRFGFDVVGGDPHGHLEMRREPTMEYPTASMRSNRT